MIVCESFWVLLDRSSLLDTLVIPIGDPIVWQVLVSIVFAPVLRCLNALGVFMYWFYELDEASSKDGAR